LIPQEAEETEEAESRQSRDSETLLEMLDRIAAEEKAAKLAKKQAQLSWFFEPEEEIEENYADPKFLAKLEKQGSEGYGLDLSHIKWGSLTQQFNEYKKTHPEIKSLEEFAHHIVSNPNKFHKRTLKRANFYKNVLQGKGLKEGDSDSDEEIISHNNIMPMMRPTCIHPALESSTMTMNPGAYNNIKPLMGHLIGEGVGKHVHRLEHNGMTSSHYGPHASHPQMMMTGKYQKHPAMKGGAVMPSVDDLIHQGVQHLTGKFGIAPDQAQTLLHTAIHQGMDSVPHELQPFAKQGIDMGKHLLGKVMGKGFFDDIGHAFNGLGNDVKQGFNKDIVNPTEQAMGEAKQALPGVVHQLSKFTKNPYVKGTVSGLSYLAGPEVGIPASLAFTADSNALDMAQSGRNASQQINRRYIAPANKVLSNIGLSVPTLSGKGMKGEGVWEDLGKNVANNLGYLANAGSSKLVNLMGNPATHSHSMKGTGAWTH